MGGFIRFFVHINASDFNQGLEKTKVAKLGEQLKFGTVLTIEQNSTVAPKFQGGDLGSWMDNTRTHRNQNQKKLKAKEEQKKKLTSFTVYKK